MGVQKVGNATMVTNKSKKKFSLTLTLYACAECNGS